MAVRTTKSLTTTNNGIVFFEGLGLKVFHTTDYDVLQHVDLVLDDLRRFIVKYCEHEEEGL